MSATISSFGNLNFEQLAPRQIHMYELEVVAPFLSLNTSIESLEIQDDSITSCLAQQLCQYRARIMCELLNSYSTQAQASIEKLENEKKHSRELEVIEVLWITPQPYALLEDLASSLNMEQRDSLSITIGSKTLSYLLRTKTQRLRSLAPHKQDLNLKTQVEQLAKLVNLFLTSQSNSQHRTQEINSPQLNIAAQDTTKRKLIVNLNICKPSASGNELGRNYSALVYEYATGEYVSLSAREVQQEYNPQHLLRVLGCLRAGGSLHCIVTNDLVLESQSSTSYQAYIQGRNSAVSYYYHYRRHVASLLRAGSLSYENNLESTLEHTSVKGRSNLQQHLISSGKLYGVANPKTKKVTDQQARINLVDKLLNSAVRESKANNSLGEPSQCLQLELVLGERGTGKTTLVQQVARDWIQLSPTSVSPRCIYATHLATSYSRQSELEGIEFIVFDELLDYLEQQRIDCNEKTAQEDSNYLWIIDEAARVPVATLERFLAQVRGKVILATTVSSYENSGVGLVHKLLGRKMLAQLAQAEGKQSLRIWLLETNYRYPDDYLSWVQRQLTGACGIQQLLEATLEYYLNREPLARNYIEVWNVQNGNIELIGPTSSVSQMQGESNYFPAPISREQLQVRQCRSVQEMHQYFNLCYICHYQTTPQDFALALEAQQIKLFGLYLGTQLIGGCSLIEEQAQVKDNKLDLAGTFGNLALKLLNSQVAKFIVEQSRELSTVKLQRISRLFLAPGYRKGWVTISDTPNDFKEVLGSETREPRVSNKELQEYQVKLSHFLIEQLVEQGELDLQQLVVLVGYEPALIQFWSELGCRLIYCSQDLNSASGQRTAVFIHRDTTHPVLNFYTALLAQP